MLSLFSFLLPTLANIEMAFAQARPAAGIRPPKNLGNASPTGFLAIACTGLRWLFTAAILFSIVMALLAAMRYMRSSGDPAGVKDATNKLIYTAIGIAVAIFARTLPILVGSILGTTSGTDIGSVCR